MDNDLSTSLLTARTTMTQNSVQLAVLKKTHDMEASLLNALVQPVQSPPPAGQGVVVDKRA